MEVVIFTSASCGPCRQMKPLLIQLQEQYKFRLRVVEASPNTQQEFVRNGVRTVPVVLVLDEEGLRKNEALIGSKSMSDLAAFLRRQKVIPE